MRRIVALAAALLVVAAAAACTPAPQVGEPTTPTTSTVPCTPAPATDIAYANAAGVDPGLLSLDVRPAPGACTGAPTPVVVWVHGGGWAIGDKANVASKATWAAAQGWTFVSVNYRLSPTEPSTDPNRVMHPNHTKDVANALAWIADHIGEYGGDASRLVLIGHSAGGHLVSLVSVDPTYLTGASAPVDLVDCTVALDTEGYDLLRKVEGGESSAAMVHNAFGDDPAMLRAASPIHQVTDRERLPRFLVLTRGAPSRREIAATFRDALVRAGGQAELVVAAGYSHADVSKKLGDPTDTVVTPAVTDLISSCVAP
jgi:arylformamidase